jgi:hypothetical protein
MRDKSIFSPHVLLVLSCILFVGFSTMSFAQRHRSTTPTRSRSVVITHLPQSHITVKHTGSSFIYSRGVYYRRHPHGYVVVRPPFGLRIRALPFGYTTFSVGAVPYYYYYGTYYSYDPVSKVYVVCDKPAKEEAGDSKLDQVTLIDGNVLEGIYLKGDSKVVELEVDGKVHEIPVGKIVSIQFAPSDANADSTETDEK